MSSTKTSGLGDHFAFGGYLIGGDIQQASMHGGFKTIDSTDITQYAHSRLAAQRDGEIELTAFMNPSAGAEHAAFSPLSRSDIIATYLHGQAIGAPILCQNSKQLNYDPTRGQDGSLTEKVNCQANQYGQEWGVQLTPGPRTDTSATNGSNWNQGAATLWGAQAYLQAIALTGTDVTVTIQHSASGSGSWITLLAFAEIVSSNSNLPPSAQRISTLTSTFTATDASPAVFTLPSGSLANGTPVALSGSSLPGGFSAGTTYWVVSASGSTFELAATSGGTAINSTSAGSGTLYQVVQQYVRAVTTTSGGFTSFEFIAALVANPVAVTF
jgi:hypothetical protein